MIPSKQVEEQESLFRIFISCMTRKCVTFAGRARRREFWGYMLFAILFGGLLCGIVAGASALGWIDTSDPLAGSGVIVTCIVGLLALWLLIAGMAVATRRFHDCNLPAWPVLLGMLLLLLPIPLFFTPYGGLGGPGFFVLSMLLAACALIFILGVAIIPGGKKKNKYGLAPKGE